MIRIHKYLKVLTGRKPSPYFACLEEIEWGLAKAELTTEKCVQMSSIFPTEKSDVLKKTHSMKNCIYLSKQKITMNNN